MEQHERSKLSASPRNLQPTNKPMLTPKLLRTINSSLKQLFGRKSYQSTPPKDLSGLDYFSRLLILPNKHSVFLTETGLHHFKNIVRIVADANIFDSLADYSDVHSALDHILKNMLIKREEIIDSDELIDAIQMHVNATISRYTYAVPLIGIEMKDIDIIDIGNMEIVKSPIPHIQKLGIKCNISDIEHQIEDSKHHHWLIGTAQGTPRIAQKKFYELAMLAAGMLAVCAASTYKNGASNFEIGVIMSPQESYARTVWLSWNDNKMLTTHHRFIEKQPFVINSQIIDQFWKSSIIKNSLNIFEAKTKTQLELSITKAIYWFSDAHRDKIITMQFVKYWSCIETFFSTRDKITQHLCTGISAILTHGPIQFIDKKNYEDIKKKFDNLYDLRSRALHDANYNNISWRDVSFMSQHVSWMLINMIIISTQGYNEITQIRQAVEKIDMEFNKTNR